MFQGEHLYKNLIKLFYCEKNILTEPVKTQYGHHIIEVLERTGEKVLARHILIRTKQQI